MGVRLFAPREITLVYSLGPAGRSDRSGKASFSGTEKIRVLPSASSSGENRGSTGRSPGVLLGGGVKERESGRRNGRGDGVNEGTASFSPVNWPPVEGEGGFDRDRSTGSCALGDFSTSANNRVSPPESRPADESSLGFGVAPPLDEPPSLLGPNISVNSPAGFAGDRGWEDETSGVSWARSPLKGPRK